MLPIETHLLFTEGSNIKLTMKNLTAAFYSDRQKLQLGSLTFFYVYDHWIFCIVGKFQKKHLLKTETKMTRKVLNSYLTARNNVSTRCSTSKQFLGKKDIGDHSECKKWWPFSKIRIISEPIDDLPVFLK